MLMQIHVRRWMERYAVVVGTAGLVLAAVPAVPALAGPPPA
jgi:hypothetical protein